MHASRGVRLIFASILSSIIGIYSSMQPWTRQPTECVFCLFRQAKRSARQTRQHNRNQSDYVSIRKTKIRGKTNEEDWALVGKDRKGQFNAGRDGRSKNSGKGFAPTTSGSPNRKSVIRYTNGAQEARSMAIAGYMKSLPEAIPKALPAVKKILENKIVPFSETKQTEMQALDPNGIKWKAYKDEISILAGQKVDSILGEMYSRIVMMWTNSRTRNKSDQLVTELYLGFLDYTLASHKTEENTNTAIDIRYPTEWYAQARGAQRTIHLHVGPTNSGKTYNALKKLTEAESGFYAGPLRLLAHEVYSRFKAQGTPCDLVTGDDVRLDSNPDCMITASTVEMVNTSRPVDVAVIDEIQMMAEEQRGWAWTRAFLGANAKSVHLCGEERVIPLIRELAASMGDTLKIQHYERLNPLKCMSKSLGGNLRMLQKGDCVVAFSIVQIHAMKKEIEIATGRRCAIVYGGLPPETRAKQAELFNDPDNDYDYLVASDAIGMGLNLAVRRIIFSSVYKFDMGTDRVLTVPQIKQIAGRAGRYRNAHQANTGATNIEQQPGLVTTLVEADLPVVASALKINAPPLQKAGIIPPAEYLEEVSRRLPIEAPFEFIMRKVAREAHLHPRFYLCDISDKLRVARYVDPVPGLTIEQRVNLCAAPCGNKPVVIEALTGMARAVAAGKPVKCVDLDVIPLEILVKPPTANREYLEDLETLHQSLVLFLWLSYRFPMIMVDQPMAIHAKDLVEQKITWTLRAFSANPKLREKLGKKGLQLSQLSLAEALDQGKSGAAEAVVSLAEQKAIEKDKAERERERAGEGLNTDHIEGLDLSYEQAQELGAYEKMAMDEKVPAEEAVNVEVTTSPEEDRILDQELAKVSELKIDAADVAEDKQDSANGENGEVLDLSKSEQVREAVDLKNRQVVESEETLIATVHQDGVDEAGNEQQKAGGSG